MHKTDIPRGSRSLLSMLLYKAYGCRRSSPAALLAVLAVLALLLATPAAVSANATPVDSAPQGGGLVVPSSTAEVRIDREVLSFDFTSSRTQPRVRATYELTNLSPRPTSLDLLFLAPTQEALAIAVNGTPIAVQEARGALLPAEWSQSKQSLDPRSGEEYEIKEPMKGPSTVRAWSFRLTMSAGASSTMAAEYLSSVGEDYHRADYVVRQLLYVLGPARNWAGFGQLEVQAAVPSGYVLAASPALQKLAGSWGVSRYGATFKGVPADMLRISTIASPGPQAAWTDVVVWGSPWVSALLAGILIGKRLSRRQRRRLVTAAGVLLIAPLLSIAIAALLSLGAIYGLDPAFNERRGIATGYGGMFMFLGFLFAIFFSSGLAAFIAFVLARRSLRPATPLVLLLLSAALLLPACSPAASQSAATPVRPEASLPAITSFTREQVAVLRSPSVAANSTAADYPQGWSKSKDDPAKVLAAYPALRLKRGFVLRAYQFMEGGNGNAVVWAMPEGVDFPEPQDCSKTKQWWVLKAPQPDAALADFTQAVEGDGSAASFLAASLMAREMGDFGAQWHGIRWGTQKILYDYPVAASEARPKDAPTASLGGDSDWKWLGPRPTDWLPRVSSAGQKVTVSFYTHAVMNPQRILLHTDSFAPGSYAFEPKEEVVAEGPPGPVF